MYSNLSKIQLLSECDFYNLIKDLTFTGCCEDGGFWENKETGAIKSVKEWIVYFNDIQLACCARLIVYKYIREVNVKLDNPLEVQMQDMYFTDHNESIQASEIVNVDFGDGIGTSVSWDTSSPLIYNYTTAGKYRVRVSTVDGLIYEFTIQLYAGASGAIIVRPQLSITTSNNFSNVSISSTIYEILGNSTSWLLVEDGNITTIGTAVNTTIYSLGNHTYNYKTNPTASDENLCEMNININITCE